MKLSSDRRRGRRQAQETDRLLALAEKNISKQKYEKAIQKLIESAYLWGQTQIYCVPEDLSQKQLRMGDRIGQLHRLILSQLKSEIEARDRQLRHFQKKDRDSIKKDSKSKPTRTG